ncbi:50S ribosomal protein L18 [Helicobacter jaachi]|uniref:Large ribosomal subunit protein uL18 n=1 Tax=Helicobacter jaachi TaxID=1677920 RepID=A0A4V6I2V6_9HELI|nr:50S ribosomal protein L18 [Helicobacter jaachi]TLD97552.1 50S ribosomal protein L18 [Helicobacter jaachi]
MTDKVLKQKQILRAKRKLRARSRIFGVANKPRISVFKSNKHLYAQAIDDTAGVTLASVDGRKLGLGNNKEHAKQIATEFVSALKKANITEAVFDRNGYLYHGVVAAFADTLRENGIKL